MGPLRSPSSSYKRPACGTYATKWKTSSSSFATRCSMLNCSARGHRAQQFQIREKNMRNLPASTKKADMPRSRTAGKAGELPCRAKLLWMVRMESLLLIAKPRTSGGRSLVKDLNADKSSPSSRPGAFRSTLRMAWVAQALVITYRGQNGANNMW